MFSVDHLNAIRASEIDRVVEFLTPNAALLEIGAGTGQQAIELAHRGFDVKAIEIPDSNYAGNRIFPILQYDGRNIPYPDASFDIVYSSNVLEHVPDLATLHREIRRVLKLGGYCVHVLPTHAWRFWTTLAAFPCAVQQVRIRDLLPRVPISKSEPSRLARAWLQAGCMCVTPFFQRRHGERGNLISEHWLFHPSWWRRHFVENGFVVIHDEPMGLFYTGFMVLGSRWSFRSRERAAPLLGSACHIFKLAPVGNKQTVGQKGTT